MQYPYCIIDKYETDYEYQNLFLYYTYNIYAAGTNY